MASTQLKVLLFVIGMLLAGGGVAYYAGLFDEKALTGEEMAAADAPSETAKPAAQETASEPAQEAAAETETQPEATPGEDAGDAEATETDGDAASDADVAETATDDAIQEGTAEEDAAQEDTAAPEQAAQDDTGEESEPSQAAASGADADEDVAADVAEETSEQAEPAADDIVVPSFHVLRVEPDGSVVIAGSAAADAEVEVLSGSSVLATTMAGPSGDFAAVLDEPLSPGGYHIVLRATSPDEVVATSVETAIVSIPERESGQVVALVQEPGEPSRLITMPSVPEGMQPEDTQAAGADDASQEESGRVARLEEVPAGEPETGADAPMPAETADEPAAPADDEAEMAVAEEAAAEPVETAEAESEDPGETDREVAEAENLPEEAQAVGEEPTAQQTDMQSAEAGAAEDESPAEAAASGEDEAETEIAQAARKEASAESEEAAGEETAAPSETAEREDAEPALAEVETSDAEAETEEAAEAQQDVQSEAAAAAEAQQDAQSEAAAAAPAVAPFIEAVEIDGREIFVAGRAEPRKRVRIYINDILLGQTRVGPNANFLLETERDLPVGDYIVRADVLDSDGETVIARAAVPFRREAGEQMAAVAPSTAAARKRRTEQAAEPADTGSDTDDVQSSAGAQASAESTSAEAGPGTDDTPLAADASADTNQDEDRAESPEMAQPENQAPKGQEESGGAKSQATVEETDRQAPAQETESQPPVRDTKSEDLADEAGPAAEGADSPAMAQADDEGDAETLAGAEEKVAPRPSSGDKLGNMSPALEPVEGAVVIRRGDTLWHISRRVYGRGIRYTTIYLANQDQIRDPDLIWPGQVFALPEETEEGEPADLSAIEEQAVSPEELVREQAQPGEETTP